MPDMNSPHEYIEEDQDCYQNYPTQDEILDAILGDQSELWNDILSLSDESDMNNEHNEPTPLLGPEVGHWHKEDIRQLIAGTSFAIALIVALAWLVTVL